MKHSIKKLSTLLSKIEILTTEQLTVLKGGCGNPNDPKRCTHLIHSFLKN